jgi:hypothetical protein
MTASRAPHVIGGIEARERPGSTEEWRFWVLSWLYRQENSSEFGPEALCLVVIPERPQCVTILGLPES